MFETEERHAQQSQPAAPHPAQAETAGDTTPTGAAGPARRGGTLLEGALGRLVRIMRDAPGVRRPFDGVAIETLSAPAFRALVAERLRSLERDTAEIRSRINGLLFVVAGAVISQLALRLLG